MRNKIIFVGGIYGVGKSTLCKESSTNRNIQYYSASDIIRQYKIIQENNKSVVQDHIPLNQDLLIKGLKNIKPDNPLILLDGHFLLFDENNIPSKIPLSTFKKIHPICIIVIVDDPKNIALRLLERDQINYPIKLLDKMQDDEIQYALDIANILKVPLSKINFNDTHLFNMTIDEQIQLNGVRTI